MEHKIVMIATNQLLEERCLKIFHSLNIEIPIHIGLFEDALDIAKEQIRQGAKVIISRGGTYLYLKSQLHIPVIEIRSNIFDVAYSIKKALAYSKKIGGITLNPSFSGAERLSDFIPMDLFRYVTLDNRDEVESKVIEFKNAGIEAIIGGHHASLCAKKHGLRFVEIIADENSIKEAILDAVQALNYETEKEEKYEMIKSILDSTNEGVIGIDNNGNITNINRIAINLLEEKSDLVGKGINTIFPFFDVNKTISEERPIYNELVNINNNPFAINYVPIIVEQKAKGAVVTMQKTHNIQSLEQKIRKDLLSKGHIAKATFDESIIGSSKCIHSVKEKAKQFSKTDSTVLILGETGTGKELFAQSIHNYSFRKDNPFVAINCAALPQSILESELFGYVKGAFTGAKNEGKYGIFELAHTGTIFLDEISEIPPEVQARLLRVIQEREVTRLGSDKVIPVNVRIIAASNKNLLNEIKEKRFREDLYYRLSVLVLELPSLNKRNSDIPDLVKHFITVHCRNYTKTIITITEEAINLLCSLEYPGNIRQFSNIVECAVALCNDRIIDVDIIREALGASATSNIISASDKHTADYKSGVLSQIENETILRILAESKGNKKIAAQKLGISQVTLWRRLKKLSESNS